MSNLTFREQAAIAAMQALTPLMPDWSRDSRLVTMAWNYAEALDEERYNRKKAGREAE